MLSTPKPIYFEDPIGRAHRILQEVWQLVATKAEEARRKDKEYYDDKNHTSSRSFVPGDLVLLRGHQRKNKLVPRYIGPGIVVEDEGSRLLVDINGRRAHWHKDHIAKYQQHEDEKTEDEDEEDKEEVVMVDKKKIDHTKKKNQKSNKKDNYVEDTSRRYNLRRPRINVIRTIQYAREEGTERSLGPLDDDIRSEDQPSTLIVGSEPTQRIVTKRPREGQQTLIVTVQGESGSSPVDTEIPNSSNSGARRPRPSDATTRRAHDGRPTTDRVRARKARATTVRAHRH